MTHDVNPCFQKIIFGLSKLYRHRVEVDG